MFVNTHTFELELQHELPSSADREKYLLNNEANTCEVILTIVDHTICFIISITNDTLPSISCYVDSSVDQLRGNKHSLYRS